jgi:hypothetical protein
LNHRTTLTQGGLAASPQRAPITEAYSVLFWLAIFQLLQELANHGCEEQDMSIICIKRQAFKS